MSLASLFSGIKRAAQDARTKLAELSEQEQQLRRQRDALIAQPAAKADVKRLVSSWVDSAGSDYKQALQIALNDFIRRPAQIPARAELKHLSPLGAVKPFESDLGAGHVDQVMAAIFAEQMKSFLVKAVDGMDWGPEGLPLAERDAKVAALDKQLAQVNVDMKELITEAQAAGITLVDGYFR